MKNPLLPFKDCHQNSVAIVAALGSSLNNLPKDIDQDRIVTYGINDINRILPVRYQLLVDQIKLDHDYEDQMINDRMAWIKRNKSDNLFVKHLIQGYIWDNQVEIKTGQLLTNPPEDILRQNKLWSHQLSFVTAFSLAVYMGCKVIGLIGFDLTKDYAFDKPCNHYWKDNKEFIDQMNRVLGNVRDWCTQEDIVVMNLSSVSRIDVFEKMPPKEFLIMARGYQDAIDNRKRGN